LHEYFVYNLLISIGLIGLCSIPALKEDSIASASAPPPAKAEADGTSGSYNQQEQEQSEEGGAPVAVELQPEPPHFWAELVISIMLFLMLGGGDTVSFYMETYVGETAAIDPDDRADLLLVFFSFALVGNVIGVVGQMGITDRGLSLQACVIFSIGALASLMIVIFPHNPNVLWCAVAIFGLTNAPAISYCFNLANKLSYASPTSASIVIMGMSLGISIVPYLTSIVWEHYDMPVVLMVVAFLSMALPLPLLFVAPYCSYLKDEHDFISI
jgi:predicted MFS family arabinose efflux permease